MCHDGSSASTQDKPCAWELGDVIEEALEKLGYIKFPSLDSPDDGRSNASK